MAFGILSYLESHDPSLCCLPASTLTQLLIWCSWGCVKVKFAGLQGLTLVLTRAAARGRVFRGHGEWLCGGGGG